MDNLKKWYKEQSKKTLHECSLDDENGEYMTESEIQAIDFDDIKDDFCKLSSNIKSLKSVDSLYFDERRGMLYLIEFKNGHLGKDNNLNQRSKNIQIGKLKEKIYDSFLLLKKEMEFNLDQSKIVYILVYNEEKNKSNASTFNLAVHMGRIANKEVVRFGMDKFENYLFKEVHTLTEKAFEQRYIGQWV